MRASLRSGVFPAQESVLSSQAIVELLLPAYELTPPLACRFFRKGICDAYSVSAHDGHYFLKVYRAGRRQMLDVLEEVRLLNHLLHHGVSVVRPVARSDGEFVNSLTAPEGTRYAVLFEAVIGDAEGSDEHRRAFGAMVGKMHSAADSMALPYRRENLDMEFLIESNLAAIEPLMEGRPEDFRLIARVGEEVTGSITGLLPQTKPEYGVCHGDLHGGDAFYSEVGDATLLDFDSSGCGWRAVDIGVYLCDSWMDTSVDAEAMRQRKLSTFLEGYTTVRRLSDNELAVVQLTPAVRHIYLMGLVLRYTTTYSGWNWANDDFCDWHMKWFRHWDETRAWRGQ